MATILQISTRAKHDDQVDSTSKALDIFSNHADGFAQFEREVTGERIRDKIAASKKKGM